MAQHVRMDVKRQPGPYPGDLDQVVDGRTRKRITPLIEKQPGQLGITPLFQVVFEGSQFLGVERLLGRQAAFEALDPEPAVFEVNILTLEAAEFGDVQPMIE